MPDLWPDLWNDVVFLSLPLLVLLGGYLVKRNADRLVRHKLRR